MNDIPHSEPPDLTILLQAMAAVVGEVSKVYQAVKRAVDSGDVNDYRRALGAFDGLPAWQKERILRVAMARAEEVAKPEDDAAAPPESSASNPSASEASEPEASEPESAAPEPST